MNLKNLKNEIQEQVKNIKDLETLNNIYKKYLGKKEKMLKFSGLWENYQKKKEEMRAKK